VGCADRGQRLWRQGHHMNSPSDRWGPTGASSVRKGPIPMDPNHTTSDINPDDHYTATMAGRIRDELIQPDAEPLPSDFTWARALRTQVLDGLRDGLAGIEPTDPMFVNKSALKSVHGCEVLHQCDTGFEWSIDTAKGTI